MNRYGFLSCTETNKCMKITRVMLATYVFCGVTGCGVGRPVVTKSDNEIAWSYKQLKALTIEYQVGEKNGIVNVPSESQKQYSDIDFIKIVVQVSRSSLWIGAVIYEPRGTALCVSGHGEGPVIIESSVSHIIPGECTDEFADFVVVVKDGQRENRIPGYIQIRKGN